MKYSVTITRMWTVDNIEADSEEEAQNLAYDEIDNNNGDDFDDVEINKQNEDE